MLRRLLYRRDEREAAHLRSVVRVQVDDACLRATGDLPPRFRWTVVNGRVVDLDTVERRTRGQA